jgi:hypothetical protein
MKALKYCYNGDGNLVCPPSKVLCKQCSDEITKTMEQMVKDFAALKEDNDTKYKLTTGG